MKTKQETKQKETEKFNLNAPVLFLVFNRLDTTKKVFEQIRKAKPKQFFIAADGPRTKEEKKKTDEVRNHVLKNIDWNCEVKKLFRKENLGCKYAVSGGIDWFFENVEQGIILEDDTLPSQSFFRFCQELLEKYKNEPKVMSISGQNILGSFESEYSHVFSKNFFCWGWATWKEEWKKRDLELKSFEKAEKEGHLSQVYPSFFERKLKVKRAKDNLGQNTDSWALPYNVTHQIERVFCIVPRKNLVENIGFTGRTSTHTKENKWDKKFLHHKANELGFPLNHPNKTDANKKFDKKVLKQDILRMVLKKLS